MKCVLTIGIQEDITNFVQSEAPLVNGARELPGSDLGGGGECDFEKRRCVGSIARDALRRFQDGVQGLGVPGHEWRQ